MPVQGIKTNEDKPMTYKSKAYFENIPAGTEIEADESVYSNNIVYKFDQDKWAANPEFLERNPGWFEEVQDFEEGDYVYVHTDGYGLSRDNLEIQRVYRLYDSENARFRHLTNGREFAVISPDDGELSAIASKCYRKATTEEIVIENARAYVENHNFDEEVLDFARACYYDGYKDGMHENNAKPLDRIRKELLDRRNSVTGGMYGKYVQGAKVQEINRVLKLIEEVRNEQ